MAIVKASFTRRKEGAKASIRYIMHRPGRDGARMTRTLFGSDGQTSKQQAYEVIDHASKGSVFFRFAISPDPNQEDTQRDLHLREIARQTMNTLEEQSGKHVEWLGAVHDDHAAHRHVHVLAIVQGRLNSTDLKALTRTATAASREQRSERDQTLDHKQQRQREEEQWDLQQ